MDILLRGAGGKKEFITNSVLNYKKKKPKTIQFHKFKIRELLQKKKNAPSAKVSTDDDKVS